MQPIGIDLKPIYGTTAVGALRSQLNHTHHESQHHLKAADHLLDYHAFIQLPQHDEGLYLEPLPNFDWLAHFHLCAIQAAILHTINKRALQERIPPTSTLLVSASLSQYLVIVGARFSTQIRVKVTATEHGHTITYELSFLQNLKHKILPSMEVEEHYLDQEGQCTIPLITLSTQDKQVLDEATTGSLFTTGCEVLGDFALGSCDDTHYGFDKWMVKPGTAHFYLVPNMELRDYARILAKALLELLPTTCIALANADSPQTSVITNHTDRPYFSLILDKTITQNPGQHKLYWHLTCALITGFQAHEKWVPYPGAPTTATAASSSTAPAPGEGKPTVDGYRKQQACLPSASQQTGPPTLTIDLTTEAPPDATKASPKATAPTHPCKILG
jgi:hypothetical protein